MTIKIKNRLKELLAIKSRLENRSINLKQCAEETGVSYRSIRRWADQDTTRFDEPIIIALCDYFDCTPGDLLIRVVEEDDDPLPENETPLPLAS